MEKITITIMTLLALYILYSECIKLPKIIKKNKKLCYLVVGGIFLYYYTYRNVEGVNPADLKIISKNCDLTCVLTGLGIIGGVLGLFMIAAPFLTARLLAKAEGGGRVSGREAAPSGSE